MKRPVIYWYRQDLRTIDLPALDAAIATGAPLLCCYILDDESPGQWAAGGASRWWLHHSLAALEQELSALGGKLVLRQGAADRELIKLARDVDACAVYCSSVGEPWAQKLATDLAARLPEAGVQFHVQQGSLLFDPDAVLNGSGQPFKVFTPFWKACLRQPEPAPPSPRPPQISFPQATTASLALDELDLLPRRPNWAADWHDLWLPGSEAALHKLGHFLSTSLDDYEDSRNHPARNATSGLSAHLHFGEISPRQLWHAVKDHCTAHPELIQQRDKFLTELGWREFSYYLLHHFPAISEQPFKAQFAKFPWLGDANNLEAWQQGRTGYPIVDAGMRQLWRTGYMHNRVRMITASFLTKHLLLPWQLGQRWFHDTLVDADLANNSCGWQWVAGCGADAAPYFRIFNPVIQGRKFDSDGEYVRTWVPELAALPERYIHEPWSAPGEVLAGAGITLGETYPAPIVSHREARESALTAYADSKERFRSSVAD